MIQVSIRPHLIPFLYKEFEGKEARYEHRKAKTIVFLPSSSLTSYLYTQIKYSKNKHKNKQDKFLIFLVVDDKIKSKYTGKLYIEVDQFKQPLFMEEDKVREFNNLIEDLFRVCFIYYIDGCRSAGVSIRKAIDAFIDKYDLLEAGFDPENLKVLYLREKKTPNLFRLQSKSANRVYNFQ